MADVQHMPVLGVSACVWRDGQVLMVRRAKPPLYGQWSLPGGHVEPGETVLDSAHRELFEETGVKADLSHLIGIYDVIVRDDDGVLARHYAIACYGGLWTAGEPQAQSDVSEARFVTQSEIASFFVADSVRTAVDRMASILKL